MLIFLQKVHSYLFMPTINHDKNLIETICQDVVNGKMATELDEPTIKILMGASALSAISVEIQSRVNRYKVFSRVCVWVALLNVALSTYWLVEIFSNS